MANGTELIFAAESAAALSLRVTNSLNTDHHGKTRDYFTISDFKHLPEIAREIALSSNVDGKKHSQDDENLYEGSSGAQSKASPLDDGLVINTNSSEIIDTRNTQYVHYAPFPKKETEKEKSVRDIILRRNSMYGGSLNVLTNYMEERLIRWRPSVSQNNVDETLSGRHAYQQIEAEAAANVHRERPIRSEPVQTNLFSKFVASFKDDNTNSPNGGETEPIGVQPQSAHAVPGLDIENFEEFSCRAITRQYRQQPSLTNASTSEGSAASPHAALQNPVVDQQPMAQAAPLTEKDLSSLFPSINASASSQQQTTEENDSQWFCEIQWNSLVDDLQGVCCP